MNTRRKFLAELDRLWPEMAQEFERAIYDVRSAVAMRELAAAIEEGNLDRALAAVRMDAGLMSPVAEAITSTLASAGRDMVDGAVRATQRFPVGARVIAGFEVGNPRAAAWAQDRGSNLVAYITEDTRKLIAEVISEAVDAGRNPRDIARDIAGRVQAGRRRGGLVGLTSGQAGWVRNARAELESLDRGYFGRRLRDRRSDPVVERAIREGKPLTPDEIDHITGRYADRLLADRGETIARTETHAALSAGRQEGLQQLIDDGKVDADAVMRIWDATGDSRTRQTHMAAEGQERRLGEPFTVGGALLMHPGDTSLGAPGSEVIKCRCYEGIRIDFFRGLN